MDKIKDVVREVIEKISSKKVEEQIQLQEIWKRVSGEGARHTAIGGFKDGALIIHVDSSAWLFQMNIKRKTILSALQKEQPDIKKVVFKIGKI